MNEFTIKDSKEEFRIKAMNAIEILALRTQFAYDSVESTIKLFNSILERIEVKCDASWLPAKMSGRDVYFPDGLDNDVIVVNELIDYFMGTYLKSIFRKSNESN